MHDITYWGEASMRARAVPKGRPVRCGELKKGMGSTPALGTRKGRSENLPFLVPRAGVEPARVAPLVFETSASTDSAIWAWCETGREGTIFLMIIPVDGVYFFNYG